MSSPTYNGIVSVRQQMLNSPSALLLDSKTSQQARIIFEPTKTYGSSISAETKVVPHAANTHLGRHEDKA